MIRRRSKRWQAIVNYRDRNGRNHQLSKTVDTKADALAAEAEFRRQATRARSAGVRTVSADSKRSVEAWLEAATGKRSASVPS